MRGLKQTDGFTLIELLVVIMIIGILLSISLVTQRSMQRFNEDNERRDDITSIARRLEQAYANQEIGAPSYPSTAELLTDAATRSRTMQTINPDALVSPGESGVSVVAATTNDPTNPLPDMTVSQYVYQPFTSGGALCTANPSATPAANNCVRFTLFFKAAVGGSLQSVKSMHQQ